MANIIIIEPDSKLQRAMRNFLQELDPNHRIRLYDTIHDFEKHYIEREETKDMRLKDLPSLKEWAIDDINWLLKQDLTSISPLSTGELKLHLDSKSLKVIEGTTSESEIIGIPVAEYMADPNHFWISRIAEPFRDNWRAFIEDGRKDRQSLTTVPFSISNNNVLILQIESIWQRDQVTFTIHDCNSEISELIEYEKQLDEQKSQNIDNEEIPEELQLLSIIDMIIVNGTNNKFDMKHWVDKTRAQLKAERYFPEESYTKFVVTAYEENAESRQKFLHPHIDDLIYFPLDRLLFLQKIDIVLAMPAVTRPRFLFNQPVNFFVDVSKLSTIELLSDVGFAIRNPVRLARGVSGRFIFLLDEKDVPFTVFGKAIYCSPHPEHKKQFRAYFKFMGITKKQLQKLRKYLREDVRYTQFANEDSSQFEYNPDNLFISAEAKREKTVVIIDPDTVNAENIKHSILNELPNTKVLLHSSFLLFMKQHLELSNSSDLTESISAQDSSNSQDSSSAFARPSDFYQEVVSFIVDSKLQKLVRLLSPVGESSGILLGHHAKEIFAQPEGWRHLFDIEGLDEILSEIKRVVLSGQKISNVLMLKYGEFDKKNVRVNFSLGEDQQSIRIDLRPPDIVKTVNTEINSLDMIIIDESLAPNSEQWIDALYQRASLCGLIHNHQPITVIIMCRPGSGWKPERYNKPNVFGFIEKPIDARNALYDIALGLNAEFTKYTFSNISWSPKKLPVHIAREVELKALSEFGANIVYPKPLAAGSTLYLHRSIFDNAPGKNICARVYHCEEYNSDSSPGYLCSFLYFGIRDSFLKYTRSWVMENYASEKSRKD